MSPRGKFTMVKVGDSELRICPWSGFVRITMEDGLVTSFHTHDTKSQGRKAVTMQRMRRNWGLT